MSGSEETYTFRASSDLGPRARQAVETLASLLDETGSEERDEAMAAFSLTLLRRVRELGGSQNQSALFRATLEGFIEAAEKLAGDREHLCAYEERAAEDQEGRAVREAAAEAAAPRWDE
jgi:hypothetical protein